MTGTRADQADSAQRYDFGPIEFGTGSVHADVVELTGDATRILELGPATGYMSRALADRGASVVAIEIDPEMAARAESFCERVIVGDLDSLNLDEELGDERFDVIVAADVLEHLKDPLGVLRTLRSFLNPGGHFVISIPNIAHGSVRLALLSGEFNYRDLGLLDATHLRFFTRETLIEMLDAAELGIIDLHRHELDLSASEVDFDPEVVSPELRQTLETDPDARTYQYVVKAIPMEGEGLRELQGRLRELAELRQAAERAGELESALAQIGDREGELRRALIDAHDQLLRRDQELEELQDVAHKRHEEIERLQAEAQELHRQLNRITTILPVRILYFFRRLPLIRSLRR